MICDKIRSSWLSEIETRFHPSLLKLESSTLWAVFPLYYSILSPLEEKQSTVYLTAWYSALPVDARLSSLSRCSLVLISRVSTSPSKRGKSFRRSMRFGFLLSPWSIHSRALMEGLSDGVNGYKSR